MKPEELPSNSSRETGSEEKKEEGPSDTGYIVPLFEEEKVGKDEDLTPKMAALNCGDQTENPDLEMFRMQWKNEIESREPVRNTSHNTSPAVFTSNRHQEEEDEARTLFLQGVECEKQGNMSEAVHKFSKAMKLVPDIERRLHQPPTVSSSSAAPRNRSRSRPRGCSLSASENNLVRVFQQRIAERGQLFASNSDICHLGRLPVEILHLIVRYVVSNEVNLRQLETLAEVSSMMYLLARDDDLWRNIHLRSFGEGDSTAAAQQIDAPEISWRELYLAHPHLHFEGVYLSKITYIRHGEAGFQDNTYRPWHTVTYFRLMRFFSDGKILMTTSPECPQSSAALLKNRVPPKADTAVCTGTWHQDGDEVNMRVCREYAAPPKPKPSRHNKRGGSGLDYGVLRHEFAIRLRLSPLRVAGKWSLQWLENECTVTYFDGRKSTSDLEADKNAQDFPPLRFYRVKNFSDVPSGCF